MERRDLISLKSEVTELNREINRLAETVKHSISSDVVTANKNLIMLKEKVKKRSDAIVAYNFNEIKRLNRLNNKELADLLGVDPSLTSRYTNGHALPNTETILTLCDIYNIDYNLFFKELLNINQLINYANEDKIDDFGYDYESQKSILKDTYYTYFFVTNSSGKGIQEGELHIKDLKNGSGVFSIPIVEKHFNTDICVTDSLIFFNLYNSKQKNASICLIKPPLGVANEYYGGIGILQLAADSLSAPCSQKIIFSSFKIDRDLYRQELKDLLIVKPYSQSIRDEDDVTVGSYNIGIKLSKSDDEAVYNKLREIESKILASK
ncbi:helix-turn-helix transcriptional regulator [Clostridium magnum]|uniref:Helix-turn-helix domain protein n=1 Tax=Clostridium magnum DSM 2767 TaxID=1121326 RepID=A0A162TRZ6_9CLOT|nr:helix-turn-helix transcriptional regulator [Clostridium magnum]KZL92981.1 helix-turn-helix domain protein [Clostridium magnum DSM 2767]SHJ22236.1 Helix-turn-helix [Clostridium magnum DSM 2767]